MMLTKAQPKRDRSLNVQACCKSLARIIHNILDTISFVVFVSTDSLFTS